MKSELSDDMEMIMDISIDSNNDLDIRHRILKCQIVHAIVRSEPRYEVSMKSD